MKHIKKNTQVTVKHILGETAEVLVTKLGNDKYQFNCDAYVVGETCKGGFFHLRQAREVIPGKKLGHNILSWARLRKALHESGLKPINIPGGDFPIHYNDEVVIPDYSKSGAHYFVIKRSDIGKYLEALPLDEAGKARAERIAQQEAEAAAEAYRQAHDPQCIAKRVGYALWYEGGHSISGEFYKITLISEDETEFSVISPSLNTNLAHPHTCNVARIVCEAPETGIDYLSGWSAGHIDPRNHHRLKKFLNRGWSEVSVYLMPAPELATKVREESGWLDLFDNANNPELIANAKKVILESYDLYDKILKERYVYDRDSEQVTKEHLINPDTLEWKTE